MNNKNISHDNISDSEDEYSEMGVFLKDNCRLSDFLNYPYTYNILERNRRWDFEEKLCENIEEFYRSEIAKCKCDNSTLFANEWGSDNYGLLQDIIYKCIKPVYDLEIFYQNPILAREMINSYEERIQAQNKNRMVELRNNYLENGNPDKEFNWKTKAYK
tara:strand:- start:300 stop:779 length:480 start_codon:yes stop_codon:yes gene_type:complete